MEQQASHPLREKHECQTAGRAGAQPPATAVDGTAITRPIDGSQYLDVIEEQEYADRRPSADEQKPRFSYLHKEKEEPEDDAQSE